LCICTSIYLMLGYLQKANWQLEYIEVMLQQVSVHPSSEIGTRWSRDKAQHSDFSVLFLHLWPLRVKFVNVESLIVFSDINSLLHLPVITFITTTLLGINIVSPNKKFNCRSEFLQPCQTGITSNIETGSYLETHKLRIRGNMSKTAWTSKLQ
jgi:hypothetical protein